MIPHISRSVTVLMTLLVVGGLVAGAVPAPVVAQAEPLPASYYGQIEFSETGEGAPIGTEITAIAGDQQDTITVTEEGEYGGAGTYDDKLVIQEPDGGTGTPVTFEVDAPGVEETLTAETDPSDVTWESEDVLQVDLTISDTVPVQDIELSVADSSLAQGETTTATVTGIRSGAENTDVTDQSDISSGDENIATIDGATISAQSVSETSSVIITANFDGITDTTSIAVSPSSQEDDGDDGDPSGGGGGGTTPAEDGEDDEAPPTIQDVRDTLTLVDPDSETTTEIADDDPDAPGISIQPEGTQSVRRINFNNEDLRGTVDVTEYNNPPQQVRDEVASSVADQLEEIRLHTNDELDDARAVQPEPSEINVISTSDITVTSESDDTDEDTSATVEISVDRERVNNPQNLVVVKEGFDFEEQTNRWDQLETTVQDVNEEEVTLEAQVPDFSVFAVAEIETEDEEPAGDDGEEPQEEPPEDDENIGIVIVLLLILALVGGGIWYQSEQTQNEGE